MKRRNTTKNIAVCSGKDFMVSKKNIEHSRANRRRSLYQKLVQHVSLACTATRISVSGMDVVWANEMRMGWEVGLLWSGECR